MNVQIIGGPSFPVDTVLLERLAGAVLEGQGCSQRSMVDINLVGERRMAEINLHNRGYPVPTDVLALPLQVIKPGSGGNRGPQGGPPPHLGDVVIAPDYVSRQCEREGYDFSEEMGLMVVHGVLHLLGYRHDTDEDAVIMEDLESRHLAVEGLARR